MSKKFTAQELLDLENQVIEASRTDSNIMHQYIFGQVNAPMHSTWHRFIDTHNNGEICAFRGSAKCLFRLTPEIVYRNQQLIEILAGDIQVGDLIWGWDEENCTPILTDVIDVFDNGERPIYRIITRTGREVKVTGNHPFLMWGKWVEAKDLQLGDFVGLLGEYPEGQINVPKEEARLLGHLIGNGSFVSGNKTFSTTYPEVLEDFTKCCAYLNWEVKDISTEHARGLHGIRRSNSEISVTGWIKKYNLEGKKSIEKTIPTFVFDWNNESIGHLLGAYFTCDGSIWNTGSCQQISLSSGSEKLVKQVQSLLVRLGIRSNVQYSPQKLNGRWFDSWQLSICQSKSKRLFKERVFLVGEKYRKLHALRNKKEQGNLVPKAWTTWLKNSKGVNIYYPGTTKEKVRKFAIRDNNLDILKWTNDTLDWDIVDKIEILPAEPTVGIQTRHHTIIINDLITHNTENMSVSRSLWEIGKNPNIRIKIGTETDNLATKILSRISATVLKNTKYHKVFPHIKRSRYGTWSKTAITVERDVDHKDPTIEASGILTAGTGGRADLIWFDDISGMRNAITFPALREQVKESFYSDWLQLLDGEHARWYLVGTPWHKEDIVSDLRNNPNIYKCQEWAVGKNFESPWPGRFTSEFFRQKLLTLGRKHYNRAYRLIAVDDSESWLNAESLKLHRDFNVRAQEVAANQDLAKYMGVDLGHRPGQHNSPTVIFTVAYTPNGRRIPCDIRISRDASPLSIARAILTACQDLNPSRVTVENVGAQQYLIELLKELGPGTWDIKGYYTGAQKFDGVVGVPNLLAEIERGKWIIPLGTGGNHNDDCLCNFCIWMSELLDFPNGSQDTVMASWLALQGIRTTLERANTGGNFSLWTYSPQ